MNSEIILCKNIKLDRNYNNVLNYSESDMLSLCRTNAIASASDYSFLRPTGNIFVGFTYSQCLQANYIAFQNKDYSNKWFFAWIDDVIYKGNNNCEIRFTVDAWSTWFSKVVPHKCFINRQHVMDDTVGLHTIDENLRVQEVVQEGNAIEDNTYHNYIWIAIETAWLPNDNSLEGGKQFSGITVINRSISGIKLILFKIRLESQYISNDYLNVSEFIVRTLGDKHIEDIQNIYVLPDACIDETKTTLHTTQVGIYQQVEINFWTIGNTYTSNEFFTTITKNTSFGNFVPKNNKVFCYPYNYLFVSNNAGSQNIYKYEDFSGNNCIFKNQLAMNVGCSGRLVPTNYKGMEQNDDESLPLAKYPTCSWSSDAFTNWLSQQAVNQATNMAFGIFGAGQNYSNDINRVNTNNRKVAETGRGTEMSSIGADFGLALNISSMIANQIGNFYTGELLPNIQGGTNTGDVNFASGRNCFTFRKMHAKQEFLECIDDYFSRYGYKINKMDTPNINGRTYWNYIEIASTEEIGYGEIPSRFMEEINNACRKGVTIWHNHTNIGNYDLNNTIVTP